MVKSEPPSPGVASPSQIPTQYAPHSRLSSPFTERLSLGDRTPTKSRTPRRDITHPTSPTPVQHLIHVDDVFFSAPTELPLLAAPSPQRARDEESESIRLLLVDRELARIKEAESRRPEYLVRSQRALSSIDLGDKDHVSAQDNSLADPAIPEGNGSLGIAVTPIRGRRLKLFQETSEESFEESLMVNGYGYTGSTQHIQQGPGHPLSQHTLEWLQQRSPGVVLPPHLNKPVQGQSVPEPFSAKEMRKRKRLAAFKASSLKPVEPSKLTPVEVEGRGRLLLNMDEHGVFREGFKQEARSSKRSRSRRKNRVNAGVGSSSGRRNVHLEHVIGYDLETSGPDWLDSEFPWCLKANERAELIKEEEEERIMWIERFLDRDTDEEESEGEEIMPSVSLGDIYEHPTMLARKGRGKMVPLTSDPEHRGHMFFPSDPADARAALLSKRAVRLLAYRRAKQKEYDEESDRGNDEVCVCGGKNDSRSLVQCDDCERWYHLRCVGIKHVDELGGDDDPWYCRDCLRKARKTETLESVLLPSEPTIVPTDDDRASSPPIDPLLFDGSLEQSPMPNWTTVNSPKTPTRGRNLLEQFSVSGSSSTVNTAPKGGPYTPRDSHSARATRVYATPGFLGDLDGESNFDPTSTPSRGIKIGGAFVTPKNSSAWSNNRPWTGGLFHTPSKTASSRSQWMDESGSVNFSSPFPRSSNHDTPVRGKEGPRISSLSVSSAHRLFESPSMLGGGYSGRDTGGSWQNYPPMMMLDDSPVVRSAGKKRLRHEVDMGDGMPE
jgi:PHD-finger